MALTLSQKLFRAANADPSTTEGKFFAAQATEALDDAFDRALRERAARRQLGIAILDLANHEQSRRSR